MPWEARAEWGLRLDDGYPRVCIEQTGTLATNGCPTAERAGPTGGFNRKPTGFAIAQNTVMTFVCPSQPGPIALAESVDQIPGPRCSIVISEAGGGNVNSDNFSMSVEVIGFRNTVDGVFLANLIFVISSIRQTLADNRPERPGLSFRETFSNGLSNTGDGRGDSVIWRFDRVRDLLTISLYASRMRSSNGQIFRSFGFVAFRFQFQHAPFAEKESRWQFSTPGGLHVLMCRRFGAVSSTSDGATRYGTRSIAGLSK